VFGTGAAKRNKTKPTAVAQAVSGKKRLEAGAQVLEIALLLPLLRRLEQGADFSDSEWRCGGEKCLRALIRLGPD
jgi:hypothetical protein